MNKTSFKFILVILFTVFASACSNITKFEKQHLTAYADKVSGTEEKRYFWISLKGNLQASEFAKLRLQLLPSSIPISISDLTPAKVAEILPRYIPPKQWPAHIREKALKDMAFQGNGFYILFENDLPTLIGICSHCAGEVNYPALLLPNQPEVFVLPLTKSQMFTLFGQPERLYKVNEIRY